MLFRSLFTSPDLRSAPLYKSFLSIIENYFSDQPDHYSAGISLLALLRAPSTAYPHSIQGHLNYIRQNWSSLLGEGFFNELLLVLGRINEEIKPFWTLSEKSENPLNFSLSSYKIDSEN